MLSHEERLFYSGGALYAVLSQELHAYFYEDGTPKTLERYKERLLDGEVLLYWPNGQMKRRSHFIQGKRQGIDQMWNPKGVLVDEGAYENGKAVGIHRRFREDGSFIEEISYIDAARFDLREWDEKGELRVEALWDGAQYRERIWDRSKAKWVFKQGQWDGKKIVYSPVSL